MYQFFAENLGLCLLVGGGIFVGLSIIADLVHSALRSWEPIEVDRGEIVEKGHDQ